MKNYLMDTFKYNDDANKKLLNKIKLLGNKGESVKFFSHLINSQDKWMARIMHDPAAKKMSWWEPLYDFEKLEDEWTKSLNTWIDYISSKTEEELSEAVKFVGFDDTVWEATQQDIALQLNYHSIHHRAQIQTLIRQQGIEPDYLDYIGTKYKKLS